MAKKQIPQAIDTHHLLWQRRYWNYGNVKALRLCPYCRLKIYTSLHREIHVNINHIPVPSQLNAKMALDSIKLLKCQGVINENDDIEKRLLVLIALFQCVEQETADSLEKQLKIIRRFYQKPP